MLMNFTPSLKKPDFKIAPASPPRRAPAAGARGGVSGAACRCRVAGGDAASPAGSPAHTSASCGFIPAGSAPAFPWASQQGVPVQPRQAGGTRLSRAGGILGLLPAAELPSQSSHPTAPIPQLPSQSSCPSLRQPLDFSHEIQAVQAVQTSAAQP